MLNKIYMTPWKISKPDNLFLDYLENLLPWTYLEFEWPLSAMISSVIFISLQTKKIWSSIKKLQHYGKARVVHVSMSTSKNKPTI